MNFSFERDRIEQVLRLYSVSGTGKSSFEIRASAVVTSRTAIRFRLGLHLEFR